MAFESIKFDGNSSPSDVKEDGRARRACLARVSGESMARSKAGRGRVIVLAGAVDTGAWLAG